MPSLPMPVTYTVLDADGVQQWACRDGGYTDSSGVTWTLTQESGWMGKAAPRVAVTPRPYEDGVYDGPTYQPGRTVNLSGVMVAPTQTALHEAIDRISALLGTGARVGVLRVDEPHMSRQAFVRVDDEIKADRAQTALGRWAVQLFAPDPRRYGLVPHSVPTGLPSFGDGWSYSYAYNYQYGDPGQSGSVNAFNAGNVDVWPKFTIAGPVTNPVITHTGIGKRLAFTIDIADGDTLVIDAADKTVRLNDQVSRRNTLAARSDWWQLAPGNNVHQFTARSSPGGASLTVEWQDAWS